MLCMHDLIWEKVRFKLIIQLSENDVHRIAYEHFEGPTLTKEHIPNSPGIINNITLIFIRFVSSTYPQLKSNMRIGE